MPLAGRDADVGVTALVATSSTDEPATRSTGPGASTTIAGFVQITDASRRHFERDGGVDPVLFVEALGSTTLVPSSDYTVNSVQGIFTWKLGADPSTGVYTADIPFLTVSSVAGGREWGLTVEADMFEVSTFGSSGWKQFQPNLAGASVSIGRYWADSTFFDYMAVDALFVVELTPDSGDGSTSARYEGFARIGSDQTNAAVDAIVGETINMVVDGQLYFTT